MSEVEEKLRYSQIQLQQQKEEQHNLHLQLQDSDSEITHQRLKIQELTKTLDNTEHLLHQQQEENQRQKQENIQTHDKLAQANREIRDLENKRDTLSAQSNELC